jgi:hypothetical protein
MNPYSDFHGKYLEGLVSLKDLYEKANSAVILHEYITGEFYFPSIILFRDF